MLEGYLRSLRIVEPGALDGIADAWRDLEQNCADPLNYFQTHDWCTKWIAHFCDDACQPFIVTLWRGETLMALWPLMVTQSAGLRLLEALGMPHTQYCGLLVRDGVDAADLDGLLDLARQRSGCDAIGLRAVPGDTMLARLLDGMPKVAGADNTASMLDLSAFASSEDYTQQLGKLQKRNRNRRRNHLARQGELSFQTVWPGHPDFALLVKICGDMKRKWLSETGRYSTGFALDNFEQFLASLGGNQARGEGALLFVLFVDDVPVAIELGFLRQHHYYAYMGGFDWVLRDLSPGKVQMDMTVCWLIDNGVKTYDLLTNPAEYKSSWSSTSLPVVAHAEALTWKGRVYVDAWLPAVRPALKRLHGKLPALASRASILLRNSLCLLLYV